ACCGRSCHTRSAASFWPGTAGSSQAETRSSPGGAVWTRRKGSGLLTSVPSRLRLPVRGEHSLGQVEAFFVNLDIGGGEPCVGKGLADDSASRRGEETAKLVGLGLKFVAFLGPHDLRSL